MVPLQSPQGKFCHVNAANSMPFEMIHSRNLSSALSNQVLHSIQDCLSCIAPPPNDSQFSETLSLDHMGICERIYYIWVAQSAHYICLRYTVIPECLQDTALNLCGVAFRLMDSSRQLPPCHSRWLAMLDLVLPEAQKIFPEFTLHAVEMKVPGTERELQFINTEHGWVPEKSFMANDESKLIFIYIKGLIVYLQDVLKLIIWFHDKK